MNFTTIKKSSPIAYERFLQHMKQSFEDDTIHADEETGDLVSDEGYKADDLTEIYKFFDTNGLRLLVSFGDEADNFLWFFLLFAPQQEESGKVIWTEIYECDPTYIQRSESESDGFTKAFEILNSVLAASTLSQQKENTSEEDTGDGTIVMTVDESVDNRVHTTEVRSEVTYTKEEEDTTTGVMRMENEEEAEGEEEQEEKEEEEEESEETEEEKEPEEDSEENDEPKQKTKTFGLSSEQDVKKLIREQAYIPKKNGAKKKAPATKRNIKTGKRMPPPTKL